jgi:Extensin-like protein C-terminus
MTVLGPGSDGYHEDHVHVDLAERRNGYRICEWDVREPAEASAAVLADTVPLPRPRPLAAR